MSNFVVCGFDTTRADRSFECRLPSRQSSRSRRGSTTSAVDASRPVYVPSIWLVRDLATDVQYRFFSVTTVNEPWILDTKVKYISKNITGRTLCSCIGLDSSLKKKGKKKNIKCLYVHPEVNCWSRRSLRSFSVSACDNFIQQLKLAVERFRRFHVTMPLIKDYRTLKECIWLPYPCLHASNYCMPLTTLKSELHGRKRETGLRGVN
jgi:hypothetical protein